MKAVILPIFILLLITACSSQTGRYQQKHDSSPVRKPTRVELHDPIPRIETPSRGGNRNYVVRGKSYKVISSAENFTETGTASWYGKKFHGHLTSNGEIYDMYAMSAAHKNLPLPTYVKVTNLANQKSVIVRVNDRGPFHQSRVIDLSYSAAYKLDMLKTGTAKVQIEAITAKNIVSITAPPAEKEGTTLIAKDANTLKQHAIKDNKGVAPSIIPSSAPAISRKTKEEDNYYIQVFATKNLDSAQKAHKLLSPKLSHEIIYPYRDGIFRVFVGPIPSTFEKDSLLEQIKILGYPQAYVKQKIN